jgi:hypothetical protein
VAEAETQSHLPAWAQKLESGLQEPGLQWLLGVVSMLAQELGVGLSGIQERLAKPQPSPKNSAIFVVWPRVEIDNVARAHAGWFCCSAHFSSPFCRLVAACV